jgi:hypothetical protein
MLILLLGCRPREGTGAAVQHSSSSARTNSSICPAAAAAWAPLARCRRGVAAPRRRCLAADSKGRQRHAPSPRPSWLRRCCARATCQSARRCLVCEPPPLLLPARKAVRARVRCSPSPVPRCAVRQPLLSLSSLRRRAPLDRDALQHLSARRLSHTRSSAALHGRLSAAPSLCGTAAADTGCLSRRRSRARSSLHAQDTPEKLAGLKSPLGTSRGPCRTHGLVGQWIGTA